MREILFRGKMISGAWVYGDLQQHKSGTFSIRSDDFSAMMAVMDETVGQYTGVTDKNGNRIFEGDEVQAFLPATKARMEFTWPVMQVVFCRGEFGLLNSRGEVTSFRSFSPRVEFEIVGNTHDEQEGEQ